MWLSCKKDGKNLEILWLGSYAGWIMSYLFLTTFPVIVLGSEKMVLNQVLNQNVMKGIGESQVLQLSLWVFWAKHYSLHNKSIGTHSVDKNKIQNESVD